MAKWDYIDPRTKQPFQVITGDKVPEAIVRQFAKQHAPPPRTSPLQPVPIVSMPTPFEYSDGSVWQSPKGFLGPGVLANTVSKFIGDPQVTPDVVYKEGNKGLIGLGEIAGSLLPSGRAISTLGRRMLTQGAIPAAGEALAGGSPGQIAWHGGLGAGTQLGIEGLIRGLSLRPISKVADRMLGRHEAQVEQAATRTAQNAAGMKSQEAGKKFVQAMDKQNIADLAAPIEAAHTAEVAGVKAANTAADRAHLEQVAGIRGQNAATDQAHAEVLREGKVTAQKAQQDWLDQKAAIDARYAVQQAAHAEQGAQTVMEKAKSVIPWIDELTSDGKGLMDLLVGKGKPLIGKGYSDALQAAKTQAEQTVPTILMSPLDAQALKIRPIPADARVTSRPFVPSGVQEETGMATVQVKTGDVIDAVTRLQGKNWNLYHRTVDMLDEAGVAVDPVARNAYKHFRGITDSMDQGNVIVQDATSKAWKLMPENFTEFMRKEAAADLLRNRGMGDFNTSEIHRAMQGAPPAPQYPPQPVTPVPPLKPQGLAEPLKPQATPEPSAPELPQMPQRGPLTNPNAVAEPDVISPPEAPDFGEVTLPGSRYLRGKIGAGLGGAVGGLVGGMGHGIVGAGGGLGVGAGAGFGLGALLPDTLKTSLPIPGFDELLKNLLFTAGSGVRALTEEPTGSQVDLSKEELAAIDAEIRDAVKNKRTAADNPQSLSLEVNPVENR